MSHKFVAQAAASTINLSHQRHKYCRPRLEMSNFHWTQFIVVVSDSFILLQKLLHTFACQSTSHFIF
jgi:hypothetical protein